jgi:hypothetical protein
MGDVRSCGKLGDFTVNFLLKSGFVDMGTRTVPLYVSVCQWNNKLIVVVRFITVQSYYWFSCSGKQHWRRYQVN